jgi:hypothetical protein
MGLDNAGVWSQGAIVSASMLDMERFLLEGVPTLLHTLRTEPDSGLDGLQNAIYTFHQQAEEAIQDSEPSGEREQYVDEALARFFTKLGAEADGDEYVTRIAGPRPLRFFKGVEGQWLANWGGRPSKLR